MVEVIYSSLDNNQASQDPDEIQRLWSMRWKFVWSTVIVCQHLVLVTWPDIKPPAVGRLASLLQQFKENFSPSHPCRPVPQLGRDCPNSSSYSKIMCLPAPPYQPPSRLTRELFSAQREGYHVHICVPLCGSVCITVRARGSGMPQMEKLGYVNCQEFGGRKGPLQESYHSGCY